MFAGQTVRRLRHHHHRIGRQAATAGQLKVQLVQQIPELQPLLNSLRIAVNQQYASDQTQLRAHDEIACIPPVSGG
ncbi:MAG: MoaD/ThiS family protein [Pirellulaceae bacterium]